MARWFLEPLNKLIGVNMSSVEKYKHEWAHSSNNKFSDNRSEGLPIRHQTETSDVSDSHCFSLATELCITKLVSEKSVCYSSESSLILT